MINLTIDNFADANDLFDYIDKYEVPGHLPFTTGQVEAIYDFIKRNYPRRFFNAEDIYREWTGYSSMKEACSELGYDLSVDLINDYTVLFVTDTGEVVVAV